MAYIFVKLILIFVILCDRNLRFSLLLLKTTSAVNEKFIHTANKRNRSAKLNDNV